ncbi:hypothetical protein [Streptomyces albidochromogenes]|uniref:Uncharacterized protein n=1 Tax=Streptomyces albidochromogenes TaxID=329524 RepID=A0ABW6FKG4_9ACTN
MEREALAGLLTDGTRAATAARAAVLEGGAYTVWDGGVPCEELAGTYARRLRHTRRTGRRTLDLERAVERLRGHGAPVRLGRVDAADRSWTYLLFLDEDGESLVACTGVSRSPR